MPSTSSNQPNPKLTKKQVGKDRRETIEALRKEQRKAERRKTLLFVGIAAVLGLGLVAAAAVPAIMDSINDPAKKAISTFGASTDAASCSEVEEVAVAGTSEHVENGTNVEYDSAPPVSGKHYNAPAPFSRKFYTRTDVPPIEQLVHNLEHGYAIVWYDSTIKDDQLATLEDISKRGPEEKATGGKFIVAPWPTERGEFPEGKHVAISRWGKDKGWKQYCGQPSGDAIGKFVNAHPFSDSPEPNAA